ncbi:transposase [Aneurinibacillus thermoaerophilus]|uniref:transposase n=2 Tax=Aneurinibacillus thermoaerophilus TaxID=143495 RepID=UPI003D243249
MLYIKKLTSFVWQVSFFIYGVMTRGFSGTLTDIHREGCHSRNRRTLSHFLSHGKWDENYLMRIIQEKTWKMIRQEAKRTEEPIFIIIDDTICEKKKAFVTDIIPLWLTV